MPQLSDDDKEYIYDLADKMVGLATLQKHEILIHNVRKHMASLSCKTLDEYLELINADREVYDAFISNVTIHTTSFFREYTHFIALEKCAMEFVSRPIADVRAHKFRVLAAGCSTGQEVYSIAMVLERIRRQNPAFEYEIWGVDIDPVSLKTASSAQYEMEVCREIRDEYLDLIVRQGEEFTFSEEIRKRCHFQISNLMSGQNLPVGKFEMVFCRNVLIYFSQENVIAAIENLARGLAADGLLALGAAEINDWLVENYESCSDSTWRPKQESGEGNANAREPSASHAGAARNLETSSHIKHHSVSRKLRLKVLIVDDEEDILEVHQQFIERLGHICDTASSSALALSLLKKNSFDVAFLDIKMPGIGGIELCQMISKMAPQTKCFMVTGYADAGIALNALNAGALDVISKPTREDDFARAFSKLAKTADDQGGAKSGLIAIGSSTGGPEALAKVLKILPPNMPPIVIVQHINPGFDATLLSKIKESSRAECKIAAHGQQLDRGTVYLAPAGVQTRVRASYKGVLSFSMGDSLKVNGHCPSVDVLFESVAKLPKAINPTAYLLTGMGKDGAEGLLKIKNAGYFTGAQDEKTSVVYGMPREAALLGAAMMIGDPEKLRSMMIELGAA